MTKTAEPPRQDIVPIKQRLGMIAQGQAPLLRQPLFLVLQVLPLGAWLSLLIWRKRADLLANNPRLRRQRRLAVTIRQGLGHLRQAAQANNSDEFFAALFRLLQEQLGERLDLPASAITEAVVEERLKPAGAPDSIIAAVEELFQKCNLARYAPVKTSEELSAMIPNVESTIRELQNLNL